MSRLRDRLRAIEGVIEGRTRYPLVLIRADSDLSEKDHEDYDHARKTGTKVRLIEFHLLAYAETIEEADDLIESHKQGKHGAFGITVHKESERDVILASWDPPLPDWFGEEEEDEFE